MKKFSIIIAVDTERGIGKNGTLAWNIPEDMKFFKNTTLNTTKSHRQNAVIMGRKTWESIPQKFRPLPDRLNCVLSSKYGKNAEEIEENTFGFGDVDSCKLFLSQRNDIENIYIIGGSYLYNLILDDPCLEKIYITRVYKDFGCDTFFSPIPKYFRETSKSELKKYKDIEYQFFLYQRQLSFLQKLFGKKCL